MGPYSCLLVAACCIAKDTASGRNAIEVASTSVVVPSVANVTGVTGSVFRTRISLFNPTAFTYPIQATFHDVSGNMTKMNITMAASQMRVYDNFLGDVFGTTGAGSVRFESRQIAGGSPNFQFVVNAEVWTIVSSGRYGTSVATSSEAHPRPNPTAPAFVWILIFDRTSDASMILPARTRWLPMSSMAPTIWLRQ